MAQTILVLFIKPRIKYMAHCNHWDDDCTCDIGFFGSLILLGTMIKNDLRKPSPPPSPPPIPSPDYELKQNN